MQSLALPVARLTRPDNREGQPAPQTDCPEPGYTPGIHSISRVTETGYPASPYTRSIQDYSDFHPGLSRHSYHMSVVGGESHAITLSD